MDNPNSDRLSDLPEGILLQILSLLPTNSAIRTSVLSCRFRHLWKASSSIDLDRSTFPTGRHFVGVMGRCLRDRSAPLLHLRLKALYRKPFPIKSLTKWLVTAISLGLRHLYLQIHEKTIDALMPLILSIDSLESLSLDQLEDNPRISRRLLFTNLNMINLKRLHIKAKIVFSDVKHLIEKQQNLEYLSLSFNNITYSEVIDVSSLTVKTLKISRGYFTRVIKLSFPVLELLELTTELNASLSFSGEMPLIRKAIIKFPYLREGCFSVFGDLLTSVVNVEELDICIETLYTKEIPGASRKRKEKKNEYPFHILVDPAKENDLPIFPNLKRLKLSTCFHELIIEDLVCLLHNTPVIQSLHLVHVEHKEGYKSNKSDRWISKLPLNSEGNNKNAYFDDLHIGENKTELMKTLLLF